MNKTYPLVSVVIPAFNVELYISECLDSLLGQSYENIEIIVIDDGSSDSTYDIAMCYSNLESRVKVHRFENGGLSKARNRGLDKAKGEYVMFLDSDDYLSPTGIEYCVNSVLNNALQALYFDRESFWDGDFNPSFTTDKHRNYEYCNVVLTGREFYEKTIRDKSFLSSACYAFFSKELLTKDCFIDGILHEDEIFTAQILTSHELLRLQCSMNKIYKRRVRTNSIMTSKSSLRNVEGYLTVATELSKLYKATKILSVKSHARSMFYMACVKASDCIITDKLPAIKRLVYFSFSTPEFRARPDSYFFSIIPSFVVILKKIKNIVKR